MIAVDHARYIDNCYFANCLSLLIKREAGHIFTDLLISKRLKASSQPFTEPTTRPLVKYFWKKG